MRYGREVDRAWLIAQIALAYPDKTVVIAASRKQEVADLARGVRKWVPVTALLGEGEPAWQDRVVIGTYNRMGAGCVAIHRRDILIAADAVEILGEQGRLAMKYAMRARFYGFLPHTIKLAPADQDLVDCYFGFEEIDIPRHGCHRLPVDMVRLKIAGGPNLAASLDELTVLKRGIWRNPLRNRLITKRSQAATKWPMLAARGSPGDGSYDVQRLPSAGRNPGRHNRSRRLNSPNCSPVGQSSRARTCRSIGLPKDKQRLFLQRSAMNSESGDQQIVTSSMAGNLNLTQLDILIRADGGVGLPAIPDGSYVIENKFSTGSCSST